MGNAMLKPLKSKSEGMMEVMDKKLNDNFDNNKKAISSLKLPFSKATRNKMAGFITRAKKNEKKKN